LETLPRNGVIAELGVFRGDFSKEILTRAHPRRLYLVDTFDGMVSSGDHDGENMISVDMSKMRLSLELRFGGKPVTVVRADSVSWMQQQQSHCLDWVYIDTTHDLQQTLAELVAAQQCVKPDGYICGHDYSEKENGVIKAVDKFCASFGLKPEIFDGDGMPSYRIKNLWRDNLHGYWKKLPQMFES
jgi:hypothetical protein